MAAKLFDEEGKEVEAVSGDELEEKLREAREEGVEEGKEAAGEEFEGLKEEQEGLKEKMEEKDNKIADLEKLIEESTKDNKDINFQKLREAKEKIEEERDELKEKLEGVDDKIEGVKKETWAKIDADKLDSKMNQMAKGDPELAKKIKYHFNSFKPATEQEKDPEKRAKLILEQLSSAYSLATGGKTEGGLPGDIAATGGGHIPEPPKPGEKMSEGAKELGKNMFGLTDDDYKAAGQQ